MPDRTPYQDRLIKRYFDQRDEIMLNRLGELVTELYLAEGEAKASRLWNRVAAALEKLSIPRALTAHILEQRDPEVLARNLKHWLKDGPPDSKHAGK